MKRIAYLFLCLLLIACRTYASQIVRVPGTSVSLEPPKGFTSSKQFPGFGSAENSASILVTEMPFSFAKMRDEIVSKMKTGMAAKQMTFISQEDENQTIPPGLLLHIEQRAANIDYLKWILLTGDTQKTAMIVGTFPKDSDAELGSAIKKSVLTVAFSQRSFENVWNGISFRVTPSKKLKIAGKLANAISLTHSGRMGQKDLDDVFYIVSPFISGRVTDIKIVSEQSIRQTTDTRNVRNLKGKAISINNYRGYEIIADANDIKTRSALLLYQVVIQGTTQDYLIVGITERKQASIYLPEFRRLSSTFHIVPTHK